MSEVKSLRERALQSKDAIELLANKWRITILHILRERRSAYPRNPNSHPRGLPKGDDPDPAWHGA